MQGLRESRVLWVLLAGVLFLTSPAASQSQNDQVEIEDVEVRLTEHGPVVLLKAEDRVLWEGLEIQCRLFGVPYVPVPAADYWLRDEAEISVGRVQGVAFHTPGHTPGSMCFHFPEDQLLFAGDTLFRGGIGRTDLWGGSHDAIERSIRERLYTLEETTKVVPGHGPETEIGWERESNPFVRG